VNARGRHPGTLNHRIVARAAFEGGKPCSDTGGAGASVKLRSIASCFNTGPGGCHGLRFGPAAVVIDARRRSRRRTGGPDRRPRANGRRRGR